MLHRTNRPLTLPSTLVHAVRRTLVMASSVGLVLAMLSATASAAQPTVAQCLEASDLSLELETQEKLLATRDALRLCAALGCPHEVRDECARRIELVEQNIPGVICEVRDDTGRVRHDAQITVDGRGPAGPAHQLIELEPGTYTLLAQAPGALPQTMQVTVHAREKNRLLRFLLQSSAPRPPAAGGLAPRRAAALVAGGVGAASLATASIFAVIALDRKQEAQALCPGATCSSSAGAERWESAWQAGNFATGFLVGGVVALGAAAGLWFSFDDPNTGVALGPTQVQVKARF
jgi:hypothetical protein